jgi:alanyl-tRNA synthetase
MTRVIREEEERFSQTLDKGLVILEEELARLKAAGQGGADGEISGEFAFKLYDTFGFPLDIVNDVAGKLGVSVDEPGFMACMKEQKTRAKKAWKGSGEKDVASMFQGLLEAGVKTRFTGSTSFEDQGRIVALLGGEGEAVESLEQGQGGWLVAASTPFYGESGGQEGDLGEVSTESGGADVLETLKPSGDLTVHKIFVNEGALANGQTATLSVNARTRMASSRNHTTTHLLHAALRQVLGDHVKQSGSLVGPERLRFDFTHIAPMTPEEIARVEQIVNRAILDNIPVGREFVSQKEAVARGAMALFGEKYGDTVCLVEVPGVSMELCGGTHLVNTGQAGSFVVLSETGVAAGIRRIEAATGWNVLNHLQSLRQEMGEVQAVLKARPEEVAARAKAMAAQVKSLQKDVERLQTKLASGEGGARMAEVEEIGGVKVIAVKAEAASIKSLREQMDALKSKLPSGVAMLAAPTEDGKVTVLIAVTKDLHGKFTAPALIKDVAAEVGGSGGGRPDMAQAGGTDANGIGKAIAKLKELVAGA